MGIRRFYLFWLLAAAAQGVFASGEIKLDAGQIRALGIVSAKLPDKHQGELSGMPAQVVVPGNQLHVVSTPLPAIVELTAVGVGDHVRRGQLLARLQSPALVDAQRGLLQATTQAQLARENLARDEKLWKDGIISESRLRVAKSQSVTANAALAERRQVLRLSGMSTAAIDRLQSGNSLDSLLAVRSPISGVVLEKTVSAGQRLDAATPMFQVAILKPLELQIQVPLDSARGVKVGAVVTVPAYGAKGKLIAIGGSLSGSNQTLLMRALISEGVQNLRPGQFVEASIASTGQSTTQWEVPNGAIARLNGKAMVFVQTAAGFLAEDVTLVHVGAEYSVITGPFKGSEQIAVKGVSALKANLMGIGGAE